MLALTPPDPPTKEIAEARVICAMLAAGWSYDLEAVKEQLIEGVAGIAEWADDEGSLHPLAAMAEPLLLQFAGDREQVQAVYDRYATARDPWLRSMGDVLPRDHATEWGDLRAWRKSCGSRSREFRAIGERWGSALVLTVLADLTDLRADHARHRRARGGRGHRPASSTRGATCAYVEARLAHRPGQDRRARPRPSRA